MRMGVERYLEIMQRQRNYNEFYFECFLKCFLCMYIYYVCAQKYATVCKALSLFFSLSPSLSLSAALIEP